jgi:hypothetical protein
MSVGAPTTKVSLDNIKSKLLRPALTSHYICNFVLPSGGFIGPRMNGDVSATTLIDKLNLACSDASLPGSSLATIDIDNDFHGVSEKHAYRRLYDDRADFTFYVNASEDSKSNAYYPIRLFEAWISSCVNEQYGATPASREYSYKVYYQDTYTTDSLSITKFERDNLGNTLQYNFVKAFPISINSIPVSYDSSQLLKCTVSFTYSRYWISGLTQNTPGEPGQTTPAGIPENPFALTPESQANLNAAYTQQNLNLGNYSPGTLTNTNFNNNASAEQRAIEASIDQELQVQATGQPPSGGFTFF